MIQVTRAPRRPRRWAVPAVLAVLLAGPALPGTTSPAAAAAGEAVLTLTTVTPAALTPESALVVGVDLVAGDQPVPPGSRVELRLQRSLLSTREDVAGWTQQDLDDPVGSLVAETELPDGLAAGRTLAVSLDVPAGGTGLSDLAATWGPRGISVVLRRPDVSRLGVVRSHVVWFPADPDEQDVDQVGEPLGVTVVVPLTGPPPDPATGSPDPEQLAALVAPGGRLDAVLTAADRPGAVLALDPSVLDLVPAQDADPGTTPGTDPSSAPATSTGTATGDGEPTGDSSTAAARWVDRVGAVAARRETVLLGYGDPDVAALAHAGQGALARLADDRGRRVAQDLLDVDLMTDVAWPVGGVVDVATLDLLEGTGRTAVLLDQSSQPTGAEPVATPDGRGQVRTSDATMPSLLSDSVLGTALAAADDDGAAPAAIQRLLAETAVIALERPRTSRHVLVTAPRGWDPGPGTGAAAVDALTAAPWTRPRALEGLIDADPPDLGRAEPTISAAEQEQELDARGLERAGTAVAAVASIADAFADPRRVARPVELAAVGLASAGWRGRDDEWTAALDALDAQVRTVRESVHVVPGSTLTQVSRNVRLPVTVQNDSDQEVTVRLDVVPRSSRLVVTDTVDLTVAPGESTVGYVPVRGVGNGDTSVLVRLRSPSGNELGDPVQTRVQVRADWESWGTATVGGVAALLLVVGLVRTYRRGRVQRARDPLREAASS